MEDGFAFLRHFGRIGQKNFEIRKIGRKKIRWLCRKFMKGKCFWELQEVSAMCLPVIAKSDERHSSWKKNWSLFITFGNIWEKLQMKDKIDWKFAPENCRKPCGCFLPLLLSLPCCYSRAGILFLNQTVKRSVGRSRSVSFQK